MLGQYPLDDSRVLGGVEAVMVPLLEGLALLGKLDVCVVTCQPIDEEGVFQTASGLPLQVVRRRRLGRITFHRRDVWELGRTLRRLAPDVVHAQGMGIYAAAAAESGFPHVVTVHGVFSREAAFAQGLAGAMRGTLDRLFERYCVSRTHNLISISPYVEQEIDRIGGFRGRIVEIENPVADPYFAVSTPTLLPTVLYAGRVIRRKDLLTLLRALARVRAEVPDVILRVAGETESEPDYVAVCKQYIQQHDLNNAVRFLGSLDLMAMVEEYQHCSVVALSSRQETAPVAIAEAMAAGRPVVATNICGVPFMVKDGVNGFLAEVGDSGALAGALLRLLRESDLRVYMGQRGREMANSRFRKDAVAQKTFELYQQLAQAGR